MISVQGQSFAILWHRFGYERRGAQKVPSIIKFQCGHCVVSKTTAYTKFHGEGGEGLEGKKLGDGCASTRDTLPMAEINNSKLTTWTLHGMKAYPF